MYSAPGSERLENMITELVRKLKGDSGDIKRCIFGTDLKRFPLIFNRIANPYFSPTLDG